MTCASAQIWEDVYEYIRMFWKLMGACARLGVVKDPYEVTMVTYVYDTVYVHRQHQSIRGVQIKAKRRCVVCGCVLGIEDLSLCSLD